MVPTDVARHVHGGSPRTLTAGNGLTFTAITRVQIPSHMRKYPIEGAAYNCEARAGSLDPALIVAELACFPLLRTGIDP